jgi:CheY-like chemotaxis protein
MPLVLVVDDSQVDRVLAGRLLSRGEGMTVNFASNGIDALTSIRSSPPDLVVSDLQMPEMDGLELVEAVRREHPGLPVILMTARGSETIAVEALRRGAAGYIPKSDLANQLEETVQSVLEAIHADRGHGRVMHALARIECCFILRNDPELIPSLVGHIQEMLRCMPLGDESERLRVGRAIGQALWIAHEHGNLELPIDGAASDAEVDELSRTRRSGLPWSERRLEVQLAISPDAVVVTINYEGPPIRLRDLPRNLEEEAVEKHRLSRFLLLRAVMDEVDFEENRPSIMLMKRPCVATTQDEMELE